MHSVDALRRILWAPGELGVARAFVSGDLTVEGDLTGLLAALRHGVAARPAPDGPAFPPRRPRRRRTAGGLRPAAARLRPRSADRPAGSTRKSRDAAVISHHYDVGNDFYRLVLGPSMTYSCARFVDDRATLEEAQAAKYELICRKLGLDRRPGARLLDVGCGWGSMAIHAARHHHASVTGVTLSRAQADEARRRVAEAGLADQIEIRLQDYRDLGGEQFDAISSIGMFEHVGSPPHGRVLRDAPASAGPHRTAAEPRHLQAGRVVPRTAVLRRALRVPRRRAGRRGRGGPGHAAAGFEVRDVESLREHYARTLRHWVANLEGHWDQAVALVGPPRANIWRLYMAASALGFDDGGIAIHQVLGVVPDADGAERHAPDPDRLGLTPPNRSGRAPRTGSADGELPAVDTGRSEVGDGGGQAAKTAAASPSGSATTTGTPVSPPAAEPAPAAPGPVGARPARRPAGVLRPPRTARSGCRRRR